MSPRNRDFLGYVVEEALAGRGDRLKAYSIAVNVFHRDPSFNAAEDPIVRIEAGKLRRGLEHYYLTSGRDDPVRIEIPKGGYAPAFLLRPGAGDAPTDPASAPARHRRRPFVWLAGGGFAIGAGALAWLLLAGLGAGSDPDRTVAQEAGPTIVVMPLDAIDGGEGAQLLASGLTAELVADLMRFNAFRVFLGPPAMPGEPGSPEAVAYVVSGSVERTPSRIHVSARLTDRPTGQVQWSQSFERSLTTADIFDVRAELSSGIVSHLAQPYGIVNTAAAAKLTVARPETLFAYDCVQQAFAYRRTFAKEAYPPVRACLEEAVRRDPGYADAWAMLGFAHMDAARYGLVEETAKAGELIAGLEAAQHAVELAPAAVRSLQSLAALRFMTGDYAGAEQIQRRAIEANPNDPESLAQLGWRLNVRGNAQEGRKYLQAAVDRSVHPPAWYYANLALAQYLAGALPQARDNALLGKEHCCGVGQFILALAEVGVGHVAEARAAYAEATRQAPVLGHDASAFMANFGVAPAVIDRIVPELHKAGLAAAGPPRQPTG